MSVAATTALAIGATAAAGASVAGGLVEGNAAKSAAAAQASKAQQAQNLEYNNQQSGIGFQNQEWNQQQQNEQPYQALGQTAANSYANLLNNPFTAPTLTQAEQTPGYQFNLQTGTQAINENAAATGNLMSGNTGVALEKYGQGLATTTYQQAYQNALNQYNANLNAAGQGVNVGLTSTGQLGQEGQAAANNLSNLYLTGGQQQASQLNNQGAAIAAGDVGQANAYASMFNGLAGAVQQGVSPLGGVNPYSNVGGSPGSGGMYSYGTPDYNPASSVSNAGDLVDG